MGRLPHMYLLVCWETLYSFKINGTIYEEVGNTYITTGHRLILCLKGWIPNITKNRHLQTPTAVVII